MALIGGLGAICCLLCSPFCRRAKIMYASRQLTVFSSVQQVSLVFWSDFPAPLTTFLILKLNICRLLRFFTLPHVLLQTICLWHHVCRSRVPSFSPLRGELLCFCLLSLPPSPIFTLALLRPRSISLTLSPSLCSGNHFLFPHHSPSCLRNEPGAPAFLSLLSFI